MTLEITPVENSSDISNTAKLAEEIWRQHFTPIIGADQVVYMLAELQSIPAINNQIKSGWQYFLVKLNEEYVGYTGLVAEVDSRRLMLSKLYVKKSVQGQGIGRQILDYVENKCVAEGLNLLWLTVNRHNHGAIEFYKKRGFNIVDEVVKDIGEGFVMDDYVMEKQIKNE